jgi:hypothetical protein
MKIDDKLNEVFNLEPVQVKQEIIPQNEPGDDFDLARQTLRTLIQKNDAVISDIVSLARSSEHPRAYEVAGQLIKAQSEIAKDLMGLHKQKKEISSDEPSHIQTQNNIVFAGSTSDLMRMISAQKAKTIDSKE